MSFVIFQFYFIDDEELQEDEATSRNNEDDENSGTDAGAKDDGDDDYEESYKKKKKVSKKRGTKAERKKEKKKKKKKKGQAPPTPAGDSGEESDVAEAPCSIGEDVSKEDSDYAGSSKRSSRRVKAPRSNPDTPTPTSSSNVPSVDEVCETFGLQDVHLEYTEADYTNLLTYKLYQTQIRPILQKDNPKVSEIETLLFRY